MFFASLLLSIVGVVGRNWLSYTHRTAYGTTEYHLGALLAMAVALCGLIALSWTEQRLGRALLEAIWAAAGFMVPIAFLGGAEPAAYFVDTAVFVLLLFTAVRLISLVAVRSVLRKLVLSTAPLCDRCGYNLTGNTSGICPECGKSSSPIEPAPPVPPAGG